MVLSQYYVQQVSVQNISRDKLAYQIYIYLHICMHVCFCVFKAGIRCVPQHIFMFTYICSEKGVLPEQGCSPHWPLPVPHRPAGEKRVYQKMINDQTYYLL